jgi:hypothetical protein
MKPLYDIQDIVVQSLKYAAVGKFQKSTIE